MHSVLLRSPPDGLSHPAHTLRQQVAEPLPPGDHPQQPQHQVHIAPAQGQPARVVQVKDLLLPQLHGKTDGSPGRDGVQPQGVAQTVGGQDAVQVGVPDTCPHRVQRLVLEAAQGYAGVGAVGKAIEFVAMDGAAEAGQVTDEGTRLQCLGADLVHLGEGAHLEVAGGEAA